ncbi:MAG TPA: 23S rRNA (guanosine(2251)-2'-O)-methyltransferase RlmB [Anaerolineales bacterium]|nr:23S rRNA (guanosine(2251)-2'-O)-methyltransferase RlmB [Anaerolineales bacterium]
MKEWLYGRNPVYEVLQAGRRQMYTLRIAKGVQEKGRVADILLLCRTKHIAVEYVPRQTLDSIDRHHQGVALQVSDYPYADLTEILDQTVERGEPPFLLLLDTLKDPQNLGTLLRTAEAVGVHGVVIPLARTATITPAVVSSSSGACEHLLVTQANLAQVIDVVKEHDAWVIGLDGGADSQPANRVNLKGGLALVVGSEGEGMRRLVREKCDLLMRLPMRGKVDSLNAAVAGSVALYLALAARNPK